jgi:hypothetical protein
MVLYAAISGTAVLRASRGRTWLSPASPRASDLPLTVVHVYDSTVIADLADIGAQTGGASPHAQETRRGLHYPHHEEIR